MTHMTVHGFANGNIGWYFLLIGLSLLLLGVAIKACLRQSAWLGYPLMAIGLFTMLVVAIPPLWDDWRDTQAVAAGETQRFEGANKPPRSVHMDMDAESWADVVQHPDAGIAFRLVQGRVADEAEILSVMQKARLVDRLAIFERESGYRIVVVTTPSLGGIDIARFATEIADRRKLGAGAILLLVAPNERRARIAVGRGLAVRLPDAAAQEIMQMTILPAFRRGDIRTGIEAGAAAIIDKLMDED